MKPMMMRHAALALCGAALFVAGCGDDAKTGDASTDGNNRFSGPVEPCEVTVTPAADEVVGGVELANAPRPVTLDSLMAGVGPVSLTIPNTTASAPNDGALPDGMTLDNGVLSGTPSSAGVGGGVATLFKFTVTPSDPAATHEIEVNVAVYPQGEVVAPADTPRYWEDGPYKVWSTQPRESCEQNPEIPSVGQTPNVDLYITYPTDTEPTESGDGSVASGRWPVILFAHANNDRICDINEGYFSLHDHWASWGFLVVAVDGTSLNCQRGNTENIELRSEGQLKALEVLDALHRDPTSRFYNRVDLSRVVMAGHSRGGGASLLSAQLDGRTRAIIDLQGVDMTSFGFGNAKLPSVPTIGLTAGEDVDLNYPIVEPTEDQSTGPVSWVNINGGTHAYTGDSVPDEPDDVPLITRQQQHDITEYYTTAFLARFVGLRAEGSADAIVEDPRADAVLFSLHGTEQVSAEISELGVYTRWNRRIAGARLIDDFDDPQDSGDQSINELGGANTAEGLAAEQVLTYLPSDGSRRSVYIKATSLRLDATGQGGHFRLALSADGAPITLDVAQDVLYARVKGPDSGAAGALTLELELADGAIASLPADTVLGPLSPDNRFTQIVAPLSAFEGVAAPAEVVAVRLALDEGVIFVDDLRIE